MELNEIERGDHERAADLLENIYEAWRDNRTYDVGTAMRDKPMTKWEYKRVETLLIEGGYLKKTKENEPFCLTTRGKKFAAETLEKHEYLKVFLKEICNVEDAVADRDACRIEHVISDEVMHGIRQFVKKKTISNRIVQGQDLNVLYEPGRHVFDMGIYENDSRYPRSFSAEMAWFHTEIDAVVENHSYLVLKPKEKMARQLSYLHEGQWVQADCHEGGYVIPSDVFVYTISGNIPVIEGDAVIAFSSTDGTPKEEEIKGLNIHLW